MFQGHVPIGRGGSSPFFGTFQGVIAAPFFCARIFVPTPLLRAICRKAENGCGYRRKTLPSFLMRPALAYLNYRLRAKTRHGVHSPFMYRIVEEVIQGEGAAREADIEALRKELRRSPKTVDVEDLGAGMRRGGKPLRRKLSEMAARSATPPVQAAFLQRLASHLNAGRILELGTNLGLTTAYLAAAPHAPQTVSIEGAPALAAQAENHLRRLGLKAEIITGSFEEKLPELIDGGFIPDFVYLDGNHRKAPTLQYFDLLARCIGEDGVVAVGDIYWSAEMEEAWEAVKADPRVTVTADLYRCGLAFFRKGQAREHFTLKHP